MKKYRARQYVKINLRDHFEDDSYQESTEVLILRVRKKTYDVVYKDSLNRSNVITIGEFEILE